MIRRSAVLVTAALALTVAGCTPTAAPSSSPTATLDETQTPSPTPTQEQEVQLPADAVLSISARATADTGAALDILLVLLKPEAWDSPTGAPRADATAAWCEGEVDVSVFSAQSGFSFGQLDVTVTPVDGTEPWPTDLPLHLLPGGGGPTLAPGGNAYAVEKPDDSGSDEPGYYVPHCLQDVFVDVPGTGTAYLGWGDDGSTLDDWAYGNFGVTFDLFGEPVDPDRVTLTDCATVITELGASLGASDATLPGNFSSTQCRVGSSA